MGYLPFWAGVHEHYSGLHETVHFHISNVYIVMKLHKLLLLLIAMTVTNTFI